ncbi:MAG: NifB/NifX family molybdenum-iron cluster-binding protein [Anaerolineales bacterium]
MKIAFATDNLTTISAHLGRARHYLVVTVENGQVVSRETREKPSHQQHEHAHDHHGHEDHKHDPGFHHRLVTPITDCQMVVARGMGKPALENVQAAGLQVVLTPLHTIEEALQAYLNGALEHHPQRVH